MNIQSIAQVRGVHDSDANILTSPTARNLPSRLIERQVAALILSLLVQVLELGESLQSKVVCGVEGEKGSAESLRFATDRFRPSFAVLVGVDGAPAF